MSKLTPDTIEDMTEMKRIINAEKACKDASLTKQIKSDSITV